MTTSQIQVQAPFHVLEVTTSRRTSLLLEIGSIHTRGRLRSHDAPTCGNVLATRFTSGSEAALSRLVARSSDSALRNIRAAA